MITLKQFFVSRKIRHTFGSGDKKRDAGQTTPEDITRYDDILYGNDKKVKKWQYLDVYRAKDAVEAEGSLKKLPVIISVHGGAWVYGDKYRYQWYCMRLAQRGFAVVNYSYRLAPEAKFPASMQDTEKVFQWTADNAAAYGFDTSNVFAVGDSAGGHLLTLYTDAITNKDFGKNFDFIHEKNLTLRGVALNCGKYTLDDNDKQIKLLLSGLMPKGGTKEEVEVLRERILGRYAAVDIVDSEGNVLVKKNTMITPSRADKVVAAGIESVKIRTALTCQSETGICSKCYGANMATGQAVQVGEAVGIIAAQSIGEPGTQLTMRTFHTGGVAGEDITQGLPRVEELFEARKPKGVAIISEFAGEAEIRMNKNKREVVVTDDEGREKAYLIPYGSNTTMQEGERVHVEAGDKLTSGSINPHDILKVKDVKAVQDYIMKEVQQVYRLQGVEINDKHIEVIVRQMLKKIRVDEAGDSDFLAGTTVNLSEFNKVNKALIAEGKQPAEGKQIILGITKASLATNSFLSAASFQETTKILTEAAINGKVDPLIGLKENVIIGKLIPAGTGMKRYRDVHLNTDDMILEAKKKAAEEAEAAAAEETENGIEGLPESESEIVEEYIEVIEDESEEISEAETETEEDTEE